MIRPVAGNKEDHKELVRPMQSTSDWTDDEDGFDRVFKTQLWWWQEFRDLQNHVRGLKADVELDFEAWKTEHDLQQQRDLSEREYHRWKRGSYKLRETWEHHNRVRRFDRESFKIRAQRDGAGDDIFQHYTMQVKARLAKHGFNQPIHLHQDPSKQDQLTTWMEYLAKEYRMLDDLQKKNDNTKVEVEQAWKCIMESQHWPASRKNEQFIEGPDAEDLSEEVQRAEHKMEYALVNVERAQIRRQMYADMEPSVGDPGPRRAELEAQEATERHRIAKEVFEQCLRYQKCRRDAPGILARSENFALYVHWAENQIPLIKAEMAAAKELAAQDQVPSSGSESQSLPAPPMLVVSENVSEQIPLDHVVQEGEGEGEAFSQSVSGKPKQTGSRKRKHSQDGNEDGHSASAPDSERAKRRRDSETETVIAEKGLSPQERHSSQHPALSVAASVPSEASNSSLSEVPSDAFSDHFVAIFRAPLQGDTSQRRPKAKGEIVQRSEVPRRSARIAQLHQKKKKEAAEAVGTTSRKLPKAKREISQPSKGARKSARIAEQRRKKEAAEAMRVAGPSKASKAKSQAGTRAKRRKEQMRGKGK
jgi:hypothetical protein